MNFSPEVMKNKNYDYHGCPQFRRGDQPILELIPFFRFLPIILRFLFYWYRKSGISCLRFNFDCNFCVFSPYFQFQPILQLIPFFHSYQLYHNFSFIGTEQEKFAVLVQFYYILVYFNLFSVLAYFIGCISTYILGCLRDLLPVGLIAFRTYLLFIFVFFSYFFFQPMTNR